MFGGIRKMLSSTYMGQRGIYGIIRYLNSLNGAQPSYEMQQEMQRYSDSLQSQRQRDFFIKTISKYWTAPSSTGPVNPGTPPTYFHDPYYRGPNTPIIPPQKMIGTPPAGLIPPVTGLPIMGPHDPIDDRPFTIPENKYPGLTPPGSPQQPPLGSPPKPSGNFTIPPNENIVVSGAMKGMVRGTYGKANKKTPAKKSTKKQKPRFWGI
jgi:hypothetical protein